MKLSLKISNSSKSKIDKNHIKNMIYNSTNKDSIMLYPLPDFAEPVCNCGNKATLLTENMELLCCECVNKLLLGETLTEIREEYKTPNIKDYFEKLKLEWCLVGRDNWYTVYGRNIKADSNRVINQENLEKMFIELIHKLLNGNIENIDGNYDRDQKRLTIYF